jgi:tRNA(Ile)-lysidine synthase TilS/MesJ
LLAVSRKEILVYLKKRRIPWRKDASNDEPVFLRNRIRPTLRHWERWRPGFFDVRRS